MTSTNPDYHGAKRLSNPVSRSRRRTSSSTSDSKSHHRRSNGHGLNLKVTRPAYTESEFQKGFKHSEGNLHGALSFGHGIRDRLRCKCNVTCADVRQFLLKLLPIVSWLPRYDVRSDFVGDVVAGCTIGVMRIPQGKSDSVPHTLLICSKVKQFTW